MDITKFPQSCLKIELNGRSLLIDPGTIATQKYSVADFGELDAVIYTHRHTDHLDVAIVDELISNGAVLYGNSDVAAAVGPNKIEVIDDGEELVIADFKVKAYHMEHCLMVDGSKGVPNTGFLINDRLLLPGDSTEDQGLKSEIIALPIFGPDISFKDAFSMAKAFAAQKIIPVHFDVVGMKGEVFSNFYKMFSGSAEVKLIENGSKLNFS